jgi:16S rRNA (guanine527-N7)-methyltransferase
METERFQAAVESIGLSLSPEQILLFTQFEATLYRANETVNLTRVPQEDCWRRHFLDCLLFQDLIPEGANVLDIGTGPGFPAWPLACARPDVTVTGLDSNAKMLGFLETQPLGNLRVVNARAEEWRAPKKFDVVTGRAVAPLSAQLEISAAFCRIGGSVIPMRSPSDLESIPKINLKSLGLMLSRVVERTLEGSETPRVYPVFTKDKPTAPGYPRRWAELKRNPL